MKITTVDTHTEGQATRIVVAGLPEVGGDSMAEKRRELRARYDHLRRGLLAEPRGHAGMLGCVLVEPCDATADFGAIFWHNNGYLDVSGQAAMGVITALLETGIIDPDDGSASIALDTPAGVVHIEAALDGGRASSVIFRNVPSWVGLQGASLHVPERGEVIVDVAYGGNLCVTAWAEHLDVELAPHDLDAVTRAAMAVLEAARDKLIIRNPETGERHEITAVTVLDAPHNEPPALRGMQVYGPGSFDRAPDVAGAGARMAVMLARGEILPEQAVLVESAITSGVFHARVTDSERTGVRTTVSTEVIGRAFVTGLHDFVFDAEDPFNGGFLI
ncbi:MAG: proline racemase family protein [Acidobacteriota bacterium]